MIYYCDSLEGNDAADGLSEATAWKTLTKAQRAALAPGDRLLFRRGGVWTIAATTALSISASGTPEQPVVIGAYGEGARPKFLLDGQGRNATRLGLSLSGAYVRVSGLHVDLVNPYLNPLGLSVPYGWYVGFQVTGHHITLENVEASHLALGANWPDRTYSNRLTGSHLHHNDALWRLREGTKSAMGGMGVNVHGDDHEIDNNLFEYNGASAGPDKADGYSTPHELYNCNRSFTHHNTAIGHRKHYEAGRGVGFTCDDNRAEYNVWLSGAPDAVGPNLHQASNAFGPVRRTVFKHNTLRLLGPRSVGGYFSEPGAVSTDNIFQVGADGQAVAYGLPVTEARNLYWPKGPTPAGSLSATSRVLDPKLDPDGSLTAGGPAIGAGENGSDIGARAYVAPPPPAGIDPAEYARVVDAFTRAEQELKVMELEFAIANADRERSASQLAALRDAVRVYAAGLAELAGGGE